MERYRGEGGEITEGSQVFQSGAREICRKNTGSSVSGTIANLLLMANVFLQILVKVHVASPLFQRPLLFQWPQVQEIHGRPLKMSFTITEPSWSRECWRQWSKRWYFTRGVSQFPENGTLHSLIGAIAESPSGRGSAPLFLL